MTPRLNPEPPPSSPRPLQPPAPEPAPELIAFFNSRKLRERLLGKARWSGTPERRVEDVVQTMLTDAWAARDKWPATVGELERWLFHALHNDIIDAARADKRSPLVREKPDLKAPADAAPLDDDELPAAVVTLPEPVLQARNALQFAQEYAESRPRLKYPVLWFGQSVLLGMSYAEIAEKAGVPPKVVENALVRLRQELRVVYGPLALLLGFAAVAVMLYVLRGRINDSAVDPNLPKPTPTIVAPPRLPRRPHRRRRPELSADELRTRGLAECDAAQWTECYSDLSSASVIDPKGETSRTKAALAKAGRILAGKEP